MTKIQKKTTALLFQEIVVPNNKKLEVKSYLEDLKIKLIRYHA